MAYAASIAVAVGEALGLSKEEIHRGVAAYAPIGSRMHILRLSDGRVLLDDCYNAQPASPYRRRWRFWQEQNVSAVWRSLAIWASWET